MGKITLNTTFQDIREMLKKGDKDFIKQCNYLTSKQFSSETDKGYLVQNFHFFMTLILGGVSADKKRDGVIEFLHILYPDPEKSTYENDSTWRRNSGNFVNGLGNINKDLNDKIAQIPASTLLRDINNGSWLNFTDNKTKPIFLDDKGKSIFTPSENILGPQRVQHKMSQIVQFLVNNKQVTSKGEFSLMKDVNSLLNDAIKIRHKKQVILTGAPGTGKTFSVKEYVQDYIKNHNNNNTGLFYEFVQFHPSYDYSDFVEGLRPVQKNDQMIFERIDGRFKSFCRKVVDYNDANNLSKLNNEKVALTETDPLFFFVIDEINRADLSKVFGELMYCLEDSYRGKENHIPTQYSNLEIYDSVKKVHLNGQEPDQNGVTWDDVFKDGFFIPQNVIIVGTMNDIDKSVEAFDFALRRRFEWIDVKANVVMQDVLDSMYKQNPNVQEIVPHIIKMNNLISDEDGKKFRLTDAYHIGPAYFKGLDCTDSNTVKNTLELVFNNNVASILREYTRGKDEKSVKEFIEKCANELGVTYAG